MNPNQAPQSGDRGDIPASLYGSPPPPEDTKAIEQAREDFEAGQPPAAEEVIVDSGEAEAIRKIDEANAQAADEETAGDAQRAYEERYPGPDKI